MKSGKRSFLLYLDYKQQFDMLSDEQLGAVIRALMEYAETGERPESVDSDGMVAMCYSFLSADIDRADAKYAETCRKNSENVKKRWEKAKQADTTVYDRINQDTTVYDRKGSYTSVSSRISENTKHTDNDNDNDNDKDNDKRKDINTERARNNYSKDFETFWDAYPRKIEKANCYKQYKARINDGFTPDELLSAAKAYKAEVTKARTEQKYIKHGKTFLSANTPFVDYLPKRESGRAKEPQETARSPSENPFKQFADD